MNGSRALRILTACYSVCLFFLIFNFIQLFKRNLRLRQRFSTQQVLHFRLAIVRPNTGFRYLHLTSKRCI